MEHHDGLVAIASVVVVQLHVEVALVDAHESARRGFGDGCGSVGHRVTSVLDGSARAQAASLMTGSRWGRSCSTDFRRSSATSTIMSSWPPTMRRRPSSTRMSTVFSPYFLAAASEWRRKLEYTPA